jgi:thiamine-monophosphate kinase
LADLIGELGEKRLLREIVLPLVNRTNDPFLSGDDCGLINVPDGHLVCTSTDRVPWDLTAYRLKIMSEYDLGYYLAVLNISDIAAMGAVPAGLLLNFALPADFLIADLKQIVLGVLAAADKYNCPILGGDLSDSSEPSLCATSVGIAKRGEYLLRRGAEIGDAIYMSGSCGLSATAFRYFRDAKPIGMSLPSRDEDILREAFIRPVPQLSAGQALARQSTRATAMDNTDGLSQSLTELADANSLHYRVNLEELPIHRLTRRLADFLSAEPFDLAMGPGADFSLVGTVESSAAVEQLGMYHIGLVESGQGASIMSGETRHIIEPHGWNYFSKKAGQ